MHYEEDNNFNCNDGVYFNAIASVITVKVKPRLSLKVIWIRGVKDINDQTPGAKMR